MDQSNSASLSEPITQPLRAVGGYCDAGAVRRNSAFTLIELVVVVAIVALLIALTMPALSRARESAHRVICASNQRQIAVATFAYMEEFDQWLPCGDAGLALGNGPQSNLKMNYHPYGIAIMFETGHLDFAVDVAYCPSRPSGVRYAKYAPYGWQIYYAPHAWVESSYSYRHPRRLLEHTASCLLADVFFWDAWETIDEWGGQYFYGAPACHGDDYYNTCFTDGSVRTYVDTQQMMLSFGHFSQEAGLNYLTQANE